MYVGVVFMKNEKCFFTKLKVISRANVELSIFIDGKIFELLLLIIMEGKSKRAITSAALILR